MRKFLRLVMLLSVIALISACGQIEQVPEVNIVEPETEVALEEQELSTQATATKFYLPFPKGTKVFTSGNNYHNLGGHPSMDIIPSNWGISDIVAMRAGTVVEAYNDRNNCYPCANQPSKLYGNVVLIRHSNGSFALYAHLERGTVKVRAGQTVKQGQVLGRMGNTGNSQGAHLHLEVRLPGVANGTTYKYEAGALRPSFVEAGNGEMVAGRTYTSKNALTQTSTPAPTQNNMYGKMLVRSGNWALNGALPYSGRELTMWKYNRSDADQFWDLIAPGKYGGSNKGWMLRRKGTVYCVNAAYLYSQAPVNMWRCNPADADQQFDMLSAPSGYKMFRRQNTRYCLNAYAPRNYSRVNLYTCNPADADQKFLIR